MRAAGAGSRRTLSERLRRAVDLEHWAAFNRSFEQLCDWLRDDRARNRKRGSRPRRSCCSAATCITARSARSISAPAIGARVSAHLLAVPQPALAEGAAGCASNRVPCKCPRLCEARRLGGCRSPERDVGAFAKGHVRERDFGAEARGGATPGRRTRSPREGRPERPRRGGRPLAGGRCMTTSRVAATAREALVSGDRLLGEAISEQIRRHHRRRLHRKGWSERSTLLRAGPRPSRLRGRQLHRRPDRRRTGTARDGETRSAARVARAHHRLVLLAVVRALRDGQPVCCATCSRSLPSASTYACWRGPARRSRSSGPRSAGSRVRERVRRGDADQCALDSRERPMHCHHEKTIVVDGRVAFVGGIDLTSRPAIASTRAIIRRAAGSGGTTRAADRRPGRRRRRRPLPHALARGDRRAVRRLRAAGPAGDVELQVVRTVPERVYARSRGRLPILEAYLRALRSAERLIYLENQFLWSPEIVGVLADKLVDPPTRRVPAALVLPVNRTAARRHARPARRLVEADGGDGRFLACPSCAAGRARRSVYVHAKIGDRRRSLADARLGEPERALALQRHRDERRRPRPGTCPRDAAAALGRASRAAPPTRSPAIRAGRSTSSGGRSARSSSRAGARQPLTHRLVGLPHVSSRSEVLGPLDRLLVDG